MGKIFSKKNLCEKSIIFRQYRAGDYISPVNAFSVDFNSLSFEKKEKNFMRKNVSKFVGKVLETVFAFIFCKNIFH